MENTRGLEVKKEMRRNGNVSELGKTLNIILNTKRKIAKIDNDLISMRTINRIIKKHNYSCSRDRIIIALLNLASSKLIQIDELTKLLEASGVNLNDSIPKDKRLQEEINEYSYAKNTNRINENYLEEKSNIMFDLAEVYHGKIDNYCNFSSGNNIFPNVICKIFDRHGIPYSQIYHSTFLSEQRWSKMQSKKKNNIREYTINRAVAAGLVADLHINLGIPYEECKTIFESFGYFLRENDPQDKSLVEALL